MNSRFFAAAVVVVASVAVAGTVPSLEIIAFEGQIPWGGDGTAITSLNTPFTNSDGQAGFTGAFASGENFVWYGNVVAWRNADALFNFGLTLTGTEATMGISSLGGFVYSPSTDGEDSVFSHHGLLFRGTDPAPGLPNRWLTFNSRPTMKPDGTAWWIAGFSDSPGGSAIGRVLYVCTSTIDPLNSTSPMLMSFDVIDGFEISATGIGFAYDVSDDSTHHIHLLTMQGVPTSSNSFVYVDGRLPLRQGDAVAPDDPTTWNVFRAPGINNSGDWVVAGTTSGGPAATSEYLAVNGAIAMRRGDTIAGVTLLSNWAIRAASINNLGQVAYIWEGGSGASVSGALFVGDAGDLAGTSKVIAEIGDVFDTVGDGIADKILIDFNAVAAISLGLDFSDHPWVFAEVRLRDIATENAFDAIVRFDFSCTPGSPDLNGDWIVDGADLGILLNAWGSCAAFDCPADLNCDGLVDGADLGILLNAWGALPVACGSPLAGECCSANGSPYCNDPACCEAVCAIDPDCCLIAWDSSCWNHAQFSPACGCPIVCPESDHDCFTTGGPGCSDPSCCALVCAQDWFCCNLQWDSFCVTLAGNVCTGCSNPLAGHCCAANGSPYCNVPACCEAICASDPFCCDVEWDGICANAAANSFDCPCGFECPASDHSCLTTGGPGCTDVECCELVCTADPFCCTSAWDNSCVIGALGLCDHGESVDCPGGASGEGEPCGSDTNGGCNSTPPVFRSISCGGTICGTAWADGNSRDTDWYEITLTTETELTFTGTAAFPLVIGLLNTGGVPDCELATALDPFATALPFGTASITVCLPPGTHWLFVAPSVFNGLPCGTSNDYIVTLWCQTCLCPLDSSAEGEPCGSDTNGGCNSTPPVFGSISCGETICGTAWADGGVRDTDWYEITLTTETELTFTGTADFALRIGLINTGGIPDCALNSGFAATATAGPNGTASFTECVPPGTYWLFVAPILFDGAPCGTSNGYLVTLSCQSCCPPGASLEDEPCGSDINGGCSSTPPVFSSISCGETICGTAWAVGGVRDTDWYEVTFTSTTEMTFTATSAFPLVIGLINTGGTPDCALATGLQWFDVALPFEPASITVCLSPGTYWLFASPSGFDGLPCGTDNDYFVTLSCATCVVGGLDR